MGFEPKEGMMPDNIRLKEFLTENFDRENTKEIREFVRKEVDQTMARFDQKGWTDAQKNNMREEFEKKIVGDLFKRISDNILEQMSKSGT